MVSPLIPPPMTITFIANLPGHPAIVGFAMDRAEYRYNLESRATLQAQMRRAAQDLLAGKRGVIEVTRELSPFWSIVEPELEPWLRVFAGINSETDDLPLGPVRNHWSPDALRDADRKIAVAESRWRERGGEAASQLLQHLDKGV